MVPLIILALAGTTTLMVIGMVPGCVKVILFGVTVAGKPAAQDAVSVTVIVIPGGFVAVTLEVYDAVAPVLAVTETFWSGGLSAAIIKVGLNCIGAGGDIGSAWMHETAMIAASKTTDTQVDKCLGNMNEKVSSRLYKPC
jgi:hypothetical protein